jgi:hypothetical protein
MSRLAAEIFGIIVVVVVLAWGGVIVVSLLYGELP